MQPLCAIGERKMVELMLPQAENNMGETEPKRRLCLVQAKLKGKFCDASRRALTQ